MDIDRYSALVGVGGDGTFHEVVNGLLHRKDRKRIPVAFVGNGSGNDTLRQFGCFDIGKALDFIVKGHIIKYDIGRVTIDYESEEEVPEEKRTTHLRYNLINSAAGLIAKANARAVHHKGGCCNPYSTAMAIELFKYKNDYFSIYIDDNLVEENICPVILGVNNTKFGGAGTIMNPFSVSNDGMMELMLSSVKLKAGIKALMKFEEEAQEYKGIHGYNPDIKYYRGRIIKIVNNNQVPDKKKKKGSLCKKEE